MYVIVEYVLNTIFGSVVYKMESKIMHFFNCTYVYSPRKETQHVKKYNLLQIFNIILNTEISITLH